MRGAECARPTPAGCSHTGAKYQHIDCDNDGIKDHVCTTPGGNTPDLWLVLSSEGCPNKWGEGNRPKSKCVPAFG